MFLGARATKLAHYIIPTLEKHIFENAISHVGINVILNRMKFLFLEKFKDGIIKIGDIC